MERSSMRTLAHLLLVLMGTASTQTLAYNGYTSTVPNAPAYPSAVGCDYCHTHENTAVAALVSFGLDWRTAKNSSSQSAAWSLIFGDDSDGDGQTNGEELGDPCGQWTSGAAARSNNLSNPGSGSSTSATPSAPDADGDGISDGCDGTGEGEGEGEGEEGEGEGDEGEGEGEGGYPIDDDEVEMHPVCSASGSARGLPGAASLGALGLLAVLAAARGGRPRPGRR